MAVIVISVMMVVTVVMPVVVVGWPGALREGEVAVGVGVGVPVDPPSVSV